MTARHRPRTTLADKAESKHSGPGPSTLKEWLPPAHRGSSLSFTSLRRADPTGALLPRSKRWMNALPEELRPVHLARSYPRLVNVLALEWTRRDTLGSFIVDLLVDTRGGREGFPVEIRQELRALLAICYEAREQPPG